MTTQISFFVSGTPVPQGSMKAFRVKNSDKIVMTHSNSKLAEWRNIISDVAIKIAETNDWAIAERGEAIDVKMLFYFPRPASRKKDRNMTTRPDLDKLIRAVNDALTGILYEDDSQIVSMTPGKYYIIDNQIPGVYIEVTRF